MKGTETVYVVWGPSAEWGDGVGVLGYASNQEDAQSILREAADDEAEYGPASWRTVAEVGDIATASVEEFLDDLKAQDAYRDGGVDGLVDFLNEHLD